MTLQVVRGGAPEVPGVEVPGLACRRGEADDGVTLGLNVSPAQPVPGVDVHPRVSPGPEGMRSHPGLGSTAGLTEAAGVAVEEKVPALSGEQDRGLVVDGRDLAAAPLRPVAVVIVRAEPLHHHGVVVPPGVVGDVGRPVLVLGVDHQTEVPAARDLNVCLLSDDTVRTLRAG